MKFYISCPGDGSVGIPGSQATLDWPELDDPVSPKGQQAQSAASEMEKNEKAEYIQFVKDCLKEAFVTIFDDRHTIVQTETEVELDNRNEPELEEWIREENKKQPYGSAFDAAADCTSYFKLWEGEEESIPQWLIELAERELGKDNENSS